MERPAGWAGGLRDRPGAGPSRSPRSPFPPKVCEQRRRPAAGTGLAACASAESNSVYAERTDDPFATIAVTPLTPSATSRSSGVGVSQPIDHRTDLPAEVGPRRFLSPSQCANAHRPPPGAALELKRGCLNQESPVGPPAEAPCSLRVEHGSRGTHSGYRLREPTADRCPGAVASPPREPRGATRHRPRGRPHVGGPPGLRTARATQSGT
jgi:hypothetical protein